MIPNKPAGRIRHIFKTYMGTGGERMLPDLVRIALFLFSKDREISDWQEWRWPLNDLWFGSDGPLKKKVPSDLTEWFFDKLGIATLGNLSESIEDTPPQSPESYFENLRSTMEPWVLRHVPEHHDLDFVLPWVARELNKLLKAVDKGEAEIHDYFDAAEDLEKKATAIGMWTKAENVDLTKTDLAAALEAVQDFDTDPGSKLPQGDVVKEFEDGYTIQILWSEEELEAEGKAMQHCVGGYGNSVRSGESVIFSLRDAKGKPHVTFEWSPRSELSEFEIEELYDHIKHYLVDVHEKVPGHFVQIMGKQNEEPAPRYLPYVREFLEDRFPSDAFAVLLAVPEGETVDLSGRTFRHYDFEEGGITQPDLGRGIFKAANFWDVHFSLSDTVADVDFSDAEFHGCTFGGNVLRCNLKGALFDAATFSGPRVGGCNFDDSAWEGGSVFDDAHFSDCTFNNANFYKTSLTRAWFTRCSFVDALWESVTVLESSFVNVDFSKLSIAGDYEVDHIEMKGPTFAPGPWPEGDKTRDILERASSEEVSVNHERT